jgi:predicted phage tail protein
MKSPTQRAKVQPNQETLLLSTDGKILLEYGMTVLTLFAQVCDSAAQGTNAVVFLGLTEKLDAVSIAFKVQGQTVSVFGEDIVDALDKAKSLL